MLLFWMAFVLTRPLGATVGDFFSKPVAKGGLGFGTIGSSAVLLVDVRHAGVDDRTPTTHDAARSGKPMH
jgi:uncharacterized membrane-anchored protein